MSIIAPNIFVVRNLIDARYDNGDVYDGDWLNNKPHGEGIYVYRH